MTTQRAGLTLSLLALATAMVSPPSHSRQAADESETSLRFVAEANLATFSGRLAFRIYAEDQGLSNLAPEALLQDRHGFLWVGTQDGLFRFDGDRFERFGTDEGLPGARIHGLHETASGELLVGARGGVARFDGARFTLLGPEQGLPDGDVFDRGIASDRSGRVWIAKESGLFVSRAGAKFEPVEIVEMAGLRQVSALWVDSDDSLLFAIGSYLFRQTGASVEEVGRNWGLPTDGRAIDAIERDAAGRLYLRTSSVLWMLAPGARSLVELRGIPAATQTGKLGLDLAGNLLVLTNLGIWRAGGSQVVDGAAAPAAWERVGPFEGLPGEIPLASLVDREGTLWVGVAGVGLAQQIGFGRTRSFDRRDGLSSDVVWSVVRDPNDGAIWVGTEKGVSRQDPRSGRFAPVPLAADLDAAACYAAVASADGVIWLGFYPGGLVQLSPGPPNNGFGGRRLTRVAADRPPPRFGVFALTVDRDGVVWAGESRGLYRLAPGASTLERIELPPGGEPDSVFGLTVDGQDRLWAATRFGLVSLPTLATSTETPRRYRVSDGLRHDRLAAVAAAANGELWVSYRNEGVDRLQLTADGNITRRPLTRAEGLASEKVVFLGATPRREIWVGSGRGVDVFDATAAATTGATSGHRFHLGRSAGLPSEDTTTNAFFAEVNGQVWIGTSRGLVHHDPNLPLPHRPPPAVVLREARVGEQPLPLGGGTVTLPVGQRSIYLRWAALTYADRSAGLRYQVELVGLAGTAMVTTTPEVRYQALPAGRYQLAVALEPPGQLVPETARPAAALPQVLFELVVPPLWWERWWVRVLAGLLVLGLIPLAVGWRTRALAADRHRLEQAVSERSAELAEKNRELEVAAHTDPLTGAHNRRYFNLTVDDEVHRVLRRHREQPHGGNRDLLLILVDLDHFKGINDQHGHLVGDQVLAEAAKRLRGALRESDVLVRWGGEEFLVLSRDAAREDAHLVANRLLSAIAGSPFLLADGKRLACTCSIGWAAFPWQPESPRSTSCDEVLALADHALYAAKRAGRNRVVGAVPAVSTATDDVQVVDGKPLRLVTAASAPTA